ncbi:hypothetical protein Tsubulata_025249 [Turnera subulata]|uniref:Agenet domain-containing protein n=1 Tax=Turnera subulata TaxID=218843 RepID=A0A9Q0JJS5_9ROSI|nr:hypothetical protein Tsubulata_025249 [Turnera subulata]
MFSVGSLVEVTFEEDGLKGAWFAGKVIQSSSSRQRDTHYLVIFESLLQNNGKKPLREYFSGSYMRPSPPPLPNDQGFEVSDVVEAYYQDGWWKGVIHQVNVLEENQDQSSKTYTVYFEMPPHNITFSTKDLRHHQDWMHGRWVPSPKQKRMKGLQLSSGMLVEAKIDSKDSADVWYPGVIVEEVGFSSFMVKCNKLGNNDGALSMLTVDSSHIRPPPPNSEVNDFRVLDPVDALYNSGWRRGFISRVLSEERYIVRLKKLKDEKEFCRSKLRPHMPFVNGAWFREVKDLPVLASSEVKSKHASGSASSSKVEVIGEKSNGGTNRSAKKTPRSNFRKSRRHLATRRCGGSDSEKVKQRAEKKAKLRASDCMATLSSPWQNITGENLTNPSNFQASEVPLVQIETTNQEATATSTPLAKCSTNPLVYNQPSAEYNSFFRGNDMVNLQGEDELNWPQEGGEQQGAGRGDCEMNVEERSSNGVEPSAGIDVVLAGEQPNHVRHDGREKDAEGSAVEVAERNVPVGSEPTDEGQSVAEAFVCELTVNGQTTEEDELHTDENQNIAGDGACEMNIDVLPSKDGELPMMARLEPTAEEHNTAGDKSTEMDVNDLATKEAQTPTAVRLASAGHNLDPTTVNQLSSGRYRQVEKAITSSVINISDGEQVESSGLPFVKSSPMWNHLESLEVFQLMPQNPHFSPLVKCKEFDREGLAIGHTARFASLVERALKLQVDDPRSIFSDLLEALSSIGMFGFDVRAIEDRVKKLLSKKDGREKLQDEARNACAQIAEIKEGKLTVEDGIRANALEKSKLREEITAMTLSINILSKKIGELDDKRRQEETVVERMDCEITSLQQNVNAINASILEAENQFEALASW